MDEKLYYERERGGSRLYCRREFLNVVTEYFYCIVDYIILVRSSCNFFNSHLSRLLMAILPFRHALFRAEY